MDLVGKGILAHGVTSYCPTVVTSPSTVYHKVLPLIQPRQGGHHGATVLGVHVEGPFINKEKKGAHPPAYIFSPTEGMKSALEMYGPGFSNVRIITLAPELTGSLQVVTGCVERGVTVSLGHTMAQLADGEEAVRAGARMVTHLFNAMSSFHHRDPGLVGLLTSEKLAGKRVWYGIIADGVHAHPAAIRIAYKTNFENLVLVTDAVSAMGFKDGRYQFGQQTIEVRGDKAYVADTNVSLFEDHFSPKHNFPLEDTDGLRGDHAEQPHQVRQVCPEQRGGGSGGRLAPPGRDPGY